MNTVKIAKTDDGRARVTVVSEGERDLSAVEDAAALLGMLSVAMGWNLAAFDPENPGADPASQETSSD